MEPAITVIARFTARAGQEAAVEQVLRGMVGPTRNEPGCACYDLYRVKDAPAQFVLFEIYQGSAALEAHRATEHYKSYRARIADLLSEPIGVTVLNGLDVAAA